ncbi:GrpB family protein [Actinopolymorpha rutila]|uniref:GrpB-like predicted nucleotidyltransferase (UPF0157 family) n=1 Tax=Actinopolymorpha rutila TaxID=446787 RepID=A0A852Z8L6_9ACTN|nr:GrpB family protein [Actinopolymorpha rutila]NYH88008.1 GrpB-like predicted nucleotidyltransferase (UPF0157 family) [Actinopolymorpha rutila]
MDRAAFTGSNLGLERGSVRLAPSDATWAATFDNLARELQAALAGLAVAVEHVGSTAVPGLPAKPILDVALGVRVGVDRDALTNVLCSHGFLYRGEVPEEDGLNLMFGLELTPRQRVVNLHVVTHDSVRWREYVLLRDRLRSDPKARDAYADLKSDLARRFPNDRHAYIAGKGAFVATILADLHMERPSSAS